ncbi:hypothetical protein PVK06_016274 [Gossypium arboreum]|uniref:SWIM-type domain-containing protein n=1 Tax=Gossypium arboreum TaxID=29729 RepID=A0ABR0Q0B5_GOSAR|nr:hypothetical protein PVK06_016274 [Gossypium arboreum]
MSTSEGTSYIADHGGLDNESDVDLPRKPDPDGAEVALFSEPEPIPIEPEDVERVQLKKKKIRDSGCTRIQPTCIMSIYRKMMRWSFQIYHTESMIVQVRHWIRVNWKLFDRPNQGVTDGQYRVHLKNRTCDCGTFDALRYPCAHAIAACQNHRLDPMRYVDEVYKIEYMYNVWRYVFSLISDECKWLSVSLASFKLLPDRELRRKPKGRPCSSKICNNMNIQERTNRQKLCRWCRNPGHTIQSCPNRSS